MLLFCCTFRRSCIAAPELPKLSPILPHIYQIQALIRSSIAFSHLLKQWQVVDLRLDQFSTSTRSDSAAKRHRAPTVHVNIDIHNISRRNFTFNRAVAHSGVRTVLRRLRGFRREKTTPPELLKV